MAEETCDDKKCYKHSGLKVRGERLSGKVVSSKAKNTVIIERDHAKFYTKYQMWARERSHLAAHNPPCINAKVGDMVEIAETRKISKTKAWTVLKVLESKK